MSTAAPTIVFVGPTLRLAEVEAALPGAVTCAPVRMGDLSMLQRLPPGTIVIIDGYYETTPAVWHKEILLALHHGWRVLGTSSMGALRAAELDGHGMVGAGLIYEAYRAGELTDDDDVAILHQSVAHDYAPVSEAHVNVRATARAFVERGLIEPDDATALVRVSKAIFYKDRTWPALFAAAAESAGLAPAERLRAAWASMGPVDQKRRDALDALHAVRRGTIDWPERGARDAPRFESAWLRLLASRTLAAPCPLADALATDADRLGSLLRFDPVLYLACAQLAKLLALASVLAPGRVAAVERDPLPGGDARVPLDDRALAFQVFVHAQARRALPDAAQLVPRAAVLARESDAGLRQLARVASCLWEPVAERVAEHRLRAPEATLRRYAAAFLDRMGLTSPARFDQWLRELDLPRERVSRLFEDLYVYEHVVECWNVHYIDACAVDLCQPWWARAFALTVRVTAIDINEAWARVRRDAYWRKHLTEPSYFHYGFTGGAREFDILAKGLP